MTLFESALITQALASSGMFGLIWFVQIIHYPLFAQAAAGGQDAWIAYERAHTRRTTLVVFPLMFAELGSTALINLERIDSYLAWAGSLLVAFLWFSTFAMAVPLHAKLTKRFDAIDHKKLVAVNALRTIAWTARAGLAVWMLFAWA